MWKNRLLSLVITTILVFSGVSVIKEDTVFADEDKTLGFTWSIEILDSGISLTGVNLSIALDSNDYPHFSHYTGHGLNYTYQDAAGWHHITVDSDTGWYPNWATSIAVDSNNFPHISYSVWPNNLKYAYKDSGGWNHIIVDSTGEVGYYTSIALDSNDYPHISYYDGTNNDLKYTYKDNVGWQINTVDSTGAVGMYSSITLDSNDYPHISYTDSTNGDLKYAYQDSSGWHNITVDSIGNVGWGTSIALDNNDYPHISHHDDGNSDLKYAYQDSSGWHNITVDDVNVVGFGTSIALDSKDYPHISHRGSQQGDNVRYVYQDATGWYTSTVDSLGNWGGVSIALDSNDHPHIAYNYWRELKYARFAPSVVYINDNFNSATPGWGYDHFDVIQDGVDTVAEKGTVFVDNGTYLEHIIVNKTINLIGKDKHSTIIDGNGYYCVISRHGFGDLFNISDFTIRNGSIGFEQNNQTGYLNIENCIIKECNTGIFLRWIKGSTSKNIRDCMIYNNDKGILVDGGSNLDIVNCQIFNNSEFGIKLNALAYENGCGPYLVGCSNNCIENCSLFVNSYGIYFAGSGIPYDETLVHNNTICNCDITDNDYGIYQNNLTKDNVIYHNNLVNNVINAMDYGNNVWDNGYPCGGNYWDDYTGPDRYQGPYQDIPGSDDIGDYPYRVPGGRNADLYPLMHPVGEIGEKTIVESHPLMDGDSIYAGTGFTLFIDVDPTEAIAGVQFDLSFDPSLFQAGTVYQGSLFYGSSTYFNPGIVDNINGTINDVYIVITTPGDNVTHSGEVAFVNFTSISDTGTSWFSLSNVMVGRPDGSPVPITIINSSVTIIPHNRWDVNWDDRVNILDLIVIGQWWGETGTPCWVSADVNCDGEINILDMIMVGQHWTG